MSEVGPYLVSSSRQETGLYQGRLGKPLPDNIIRDGPSLLYAWPRLDDLHFSTLGLGVFPQSQIHASLGPGHRSLHQG